MKHIFQLYLVLFIQFSYPTLSRYFSQTNRVRLVATMDDFHRLENAGLTHIWGYSYYTPPSYTATLPAPTLYFTTGDSANIFFYNDSPENHTIHLHGLDVAQSMDGVPTTSFSVPYNDSANYSFKVPHPGTYLYHCHVLTTLHLAMGMYGMIVVNDSSENKLYLNGPTFNKTFPILTSDMFQQWNDNPLSPGPLYGYYADVFFVNGKSGTQLFTDTSQILKAFVGDSIKLNIGNIGYNKTTYVLPQELNATAYLSDGRKIPTPIAIDTLEVYPGERYTLICAPTSYYEGYIQVNYTNLKSNNLDGVNFIGINRFNHPQTIFEQSNKKDVLIYPNPVENDIFLKRSLNENYQIIDQNGKLLISGKVNGNTIKADHLKPGIYLLYLFNSGVYHFTKI